MEYIEHCINKNKIIGLGIFLGASFTFALVRTMLFVYNKGISDQWDEIVEFAEREPGIRPIYDEEDNLLLGVINKKYLQELMNGTKKGA